MVLYTWYDIQQCSSILYCYTFAIQNETYIQKAERRERNKERTRERESKESVIQELRDEIDVLQRRVEEQKLRAQRDALATEVEKGCLLYTSPSPRD